MTRTITLENFGDICNVPENSYLPDMAVEFGGKILFPIGPDRILIVTTENPADWHIASEDLLENNFGDLSQPGDVVDLFEQNERIANLLPHSEEGAKIAMVLVAAAKEGKEAFLTTLDRLLQPVTGNSQWSVKKIVGAATHLSNACLYEALRKTFALPTLAQLVIPGGLKDFFSQWEDDPNFCGPTIWRDAEDEWRFLIVTPTSSRQIEVQINGYDAELLKANPESDNYLRELPHHLVTCQINFGSGSVLAAGEVIGNLPDNFAGRVTCATGEVYSVQDYPGLCHPQLGRSAWDRQFRARHAQELGIAEEDI